MEGGSDVVKQNMEQLLSVVPNIPIAGVWCQDWSGMRQFINREVCYTRTVFQCVVFRSQTQCKAIQGNQPVFTLHEIFGFARGCGGIGSWTPLCTMAGQI